MYRFEIDKVDLQRRRQNIAPVLDHVKALQCEIVKTCNISGSSNIYVLSTHDRYGLPFRIALCLDSGLVYMVDRFTPSGYAEFYDQHYRKLVAGFNESPHDDIGFLEHGQSVYTDAILQALQGYIQLDPGAKILDVGGSTGLIVKKFVDVFDGEATVIDPALSELNRARERGLKTVHGFIEDWDSEESFDLILLCRSIEHLYDLKATLLKIRDRLSPGGLFFCDIVDFLAYCRKEGCPEVVSRVDHCFWLSAESAEHIFNALGFDVVYAFGIQASGNRSTVGYLLKKGEIRFQRVDGMSMLKEIRQLEAEWNGYLRLPNQIFRTAYIAFRQAFPKRK